MTQARIPMHLTFLTIPLAFMACSLSAFAFPAAGDPALKALFEVPDEIRFTAGFGRILLDGAPADILAFREAIVSDLDQKKIPRTHADRALRLLDTRWAEADTAGFLAAIRAGLKNPHYSARQRASCLLLNSDVDAAIRTAYEFGFSNGAMELFSVSLAAKDPQRAFQLFMECSNDNKTAFSPVPMLIRWAEMDADAAWAAINSLADKPRLKHYLSSSRASVLAHLARRDLPTALRLIGTLEGRYAQPDIMRAMIDIIINDDIPAALDVCRRINTQDAWMGFARGLRTPDGRKTLKILLESLPPAHRESGLAAFFTYNDPVLPAFHNARFIPLLEDPAMRRKVLLRFVEVHMESVYEPMPEAVIDATLARTSDMLGPPTPLPQRQHLLRHILGRKPMAVLPWILSLSDAEHAAFHEDIRSKWSDSTLAKDIPVLLAHDHPRAKALGAKLLDDWLWSSPADALDTAIRHAPERIAKQMNVYTLHKQMGEDFPKVEAQLHEITDLSARAAALRAYVLWSIGNLPPAQAKSMAQDYIQKNPKEDATDLLSRLAMRQEEEFDDAISAIPGLPEKDKDEMRGLRARGLLLKGQEKRALQLLGDIHSADAFFSALQYINNNGEVKITSWDELLSLIAARPNAHKQQDVIELIARMLVESHSNKAAPIVSRIDNKEFRDAFSTAVTLRIPPTKDANTWESAVKLGLATEAGRTMGLKAIRILANEDAKSAIQTLLKSGPDAMRQEFVQPVMENLITDDPAAAFALFKSFPTPSSSISISAILLEWARVDPQAACQAALTLPNDDARHVVYAVEAWFRQDPDAARSWVFSLPRGPARQAAATSIIQLLCSSDTDLAAALLISEFSPPFPDSLINRIAWDMSQNSYPAACRFLASLDGKIEVRRFSSTWQSILRDWSVSDPDAAARFLDSLPKTSFAKELLAAYSVVPTREAQRSDPLQLLRTGNLHRQLLSEKETDKLRQAVIQPANQSTYLADYCVYLLRNNQDKTIPQLLKDAQDIQVRKEASSGYSAVPSAITACIRHLQPSHPKRIPSFLDALAARSPEWLECAVAALWSPYVGREGAPHRITPLMAASLLRIAPEKRAKCIAASLSHARPLPEQWASFLTGEDHPDNRDEPYSAILCALAKADFPAALRAAAALPPDQGDPIVRALLAAFPSREEAAQAIRTLPPGIRPRAEAWNAALDPQAK